jgi:peptidylamidoglycolate lyase
MRQLAVAVLVSAFAGLALARPAQAADTSSMPAAPAYHLVHGWSELPVGEDLGSVSGLDVDAQNRVFVFHRANRRWPADDKLDLKPIDRPTVTVFDGATGKLLFSWGSNRFAMPHGLSVDPEGAIWLTDVAFQQVFKYSPDGKLLMTLGEKGVAGDDPYHFNRPTAVAVARDGSFYVSDGYLNTRVIKYSAAGKFLFQWGTKGAGPGQFDLIHGVVLGRDGSLYVSDRSNGRIQVFDAGGHFLKQWSSQAIGRPYAVALGADGRLFVADGGDQPDSPPDRSALVELGSDGGVLARIGRWGNQDGQMEMPHAVAVGPDGAVYVGDITGARVQKFVAPR